jgi:predicted GTPase
MKILVCITCIFFLAHSCIAQFTGQPVPNKADYLKKSKNQSTAAWVLAGGGAVMVTAGAVIGMNDVADSFGSIFTGESEEPSDAGPILFYTGAAAMLGSIPLFIASSRNKRKANSMSAFLKMENRPFVQKSSFINASYPAMGIRINL